MIVNSRYSSKRLTRLKYRLQRKPLYWVTEGGQVIKQGNNGSDVLQWAIDHSVAFSPLKLEGLFAPEKSIRLKLNGTVIEGKQ
jgi:hypothetical protein